jgi:phosphocarrier protein HPr
MLSAEVTISNRLGLHARAAAKLVRIAARFDSSIKIRKIDDSVIADAKSILSVLMLAASHGTSLVIDFEGSDEVEAMEQILGLFTSGFGEL